MHTWIRILRLGRLRLLQEAQRIAVRVAVTDPAVVCLTVGAGVHSQSATTYVAHGQAIRLTWQILAGSCMPVMQHIHRLVGLIAIRALDGLGNRDPGRGSGDVPVSPQQMRHHPGGLARGMVEPEQTTRLHVPHLLDRQL